MSNGQEGLLAARWVGCRCSVRRDEVCVGDSRWDLSGDDLRGVMSNG
jgi:hypothetical protein